MPNAGIHGTRSTNCMSAECGSNCAHTTSVTTNSTSEMPSAAQRNRLFFLPSALPTNRRSSAPTSGRAHETVRSGKLSPQVIAQHQDDTQEQGAGVGADRPVL